MPKWGALAVCQPTCRVIHGGGYRWGLRHSVNYGSESKGEIMSKGWIGVDLDGTLAVYTGWQGATHIGDPVMALVNKAKEILLNGGDVRIFTARISSPPNDAKRQRAAAEALIEIQDWCQEYIGVVLPVTNIKDYDMVCCYDDRAIQIVPNTGVRADGEPL
jgi:hypothetical protein